MKSLLAKFAFQKAVGVYLGDQEIAVSQVAVTPLGPVEVARHSEPWQGSDLSATLPKVLEPFLTRKRRHWPTSIGLSASRLFIGTRPLRTGNEASPEELMQKALSSASIRVDDFVVDMVKSQTGQSTMASMIACRKKFMTMLMAGLTECKLRPVRTEAGPCGLVRAAAAERRMPRRPKVGLRVFFQESRALAVLVASDLPIAWRSFEAPEGHEPGAVMCIVRTFQNLAHSFGVEGPIEVLMVHGRPDLHAQLESVEFVRNLGMRLYCSAGPELKPENIAYGLALGSLNPNEQGFDLSRILKPPASFRDIFPLGDLVMECVLLLGMAWVLWSQSAKVEEACNTAHTEILMHKALANASADKMDREKKELEQRVDAIRKFLDTRILWTAYTHDLPARLPSNTQLNTLQAYYELERGGKAKDAMPPKRSLLMRLVAPVPDNGSMPRQIDAFLASLRNHPLLQRDFPQVELADIKRTQDYKTGQWLANFNVICRPESAKGKPKSGGDAKKAASDGKTATEPTKPTAKPTKAGGPKKPAAEAKKTALPKKPAPAGHGTAEAKKPEPSVKPVSKTKTTKP